MFVSLHRGTSVSCISFTCVTAFLLLISSEDRFTHNTPLFSSTYLLSFSISSYGSHPQSIRVVFPYNFYGERVKLPLDKYINRTIFFLTSYIIKRLIPTVANRYNIFVDGNTVGPTYVIFLILFHMITI